MDRPNLIGLRYFMYILSRGNPIPYIDADIRKMIWSYALEPPYVTLRINPNMLVKLSVFSVE